MYASAITSVDPLRIETEQEDDGRWLADVVDLPGVLAYGATREEALAKAEALALRVIADRLEHWRTSTGARQPVCRSMIDGARLVLGACWLLCCG